MKGCVRVGALIKACVKVLRGVSGLEWLVQ